MWRLVKAEFKYNGIPYVFLFGIIFFSSLANSILGNLEQGLAFIMYFSSMCSGFLLGAESSNTHRVQFLSGLPLPVRRLWIFRHITGTYWYWTIWALLLFLSSLISQQAHIGMDYICWVLTKIGSAFFFAGCVDLTINFHYCRKSSGTGRILLLMVGVFLFLAGFGIGSFLYLFTIPGPSFYSNWPLLIALSEMFLTFPASFGLLLLGLALMVLSVFVFGMRRTYIEESSWMYPVAR